MYLELRSLLKKVIGLSKDKKGAFENHHYEVKFARHLRYLAGYASASAVASYAGGAENHDRSIKNEYKI